MPEPVPLRLPPLSRTPHRIQRSAFRWVVGDGLPFRKGDLLGFCNLGLVGEPAGLGQLFGPEESGDLQVALVARVSGTMHHIASPYGGGWSDRQIWYLWEQKSVLAHVELDPECADTPWSRMLDFHFVTGRRASSLAEDRSGLGTGWHDRSRAWRLGRPGPFGTVLGLGSCELFDTLRGEKGAFLDIFDQAPGAVHMVDVPERPVIHSARLIVEQMQRTDTDRAALEEEFRSAIMHSPPGDAALDWSFALFSLQALKRCPVRDRFDILTEQGVETVGPADAVILSIGSEQTSRLRHRRLGFLLDCRSFLYPGLSPSMREWLKANFEFVPHPVEDVKRDYLEMAQLLREEHPDRQILVLNAVSTMGSEDILSYAPYDEPMGLSLKSVRARELNSMLHEVAREADIAIVDSDAIAAELGGSIAVPDGVHQNGEMQKLLREEILSILAARKVPGFVEEAVTPPRTTPQDDLSPPTIPASLHPENR